MSAPLADAAPALRRAAQLRTLCLRLPHAPTPLERERLERFAVIETAPHLATADDAEALVAGWRRWWREQRIEPLCEMVRRTPAALIEADRRLAALALAAARRPDTG
jgi:hypothetical protein